MNCGQIGVVGYLIYYGCENGNHFSSNFKDIFSRQSQLNGIDNRNPHDREVDRDSYTFHLQAYPVEYVRGNVSGSKFSLTCCTNTLGVLSSRYPSGTGTSLTFLVEKDFRCSNLDLQQLYLAYCLEKELPILGK